MVTADELRRLKGHWVTIHLATGAPGAPAMTGQVIGTLDAVDGMLVVVEPEGRPAGRVSVHHHHVVAVAPVQPAR